MPAALTAMALNMLIANLDSYCGSAHNYYLCQRDNNGRFVHLHWDTNEAFGSFRMGVAAGQDLRTLEPLWLPSASSGAGGGPGPAAISGERPLMERLWSVTDRATIAAANLPATGNGALVFPAQLADISFGHLPDGSGTTVAMADPSPGTANHNGAPRPRRAGGRH